MMDRPMGRLSSSDYGQGRGYMAYEFGRKDPFPGSVTLYNLNGVALTGTAPADFYAQKWNATNANAVLTSQTIPYCVRNPMVYIAAHSYINWNSSPYMWYDSKVAYNSLLEKSVYDPCPPGWMMPTYGTWEDFRHQITVNDATRGLVWTALQGGLYYPNVGAVEGRIFYPYAIMRRDITGALSSGYGEGAGVMSSRAISIDTNYGFVMDSGGVTNYQSFIYNILSFGTHVRCVSMPR